MPDTFCVTCGELAELTEMPGERHCACPNGELDPEILDLVEILDSEGQIDWIRLREDVTA